MTQPTKKLEETYRFSRDYELLYRLLHEGHRIAGFIDYDGFGPDKISRDVIAMRYFEEGDRFQIGSRGIGYEPLEKKITVERFSEYCRNYNIEFIAPNSVELVDFRRSQNELTNILIVNSLYFLDDHHKYLLIEKITQKIPDEIITRLRELFKPEFPTPDRDEREINRDKDFTQTDKLHFHPTDEEQKEDPETDVRRFRGFYNPPIKGENQ